MQIKASSFPREFSIPPYPSPSAYPTPLRTEPHHSKRLGALMKQQRGVTVMPWQGAWHPSNVLWFAAAPLSFSLSLSHIFKVCWKLHNVGIVPWGQFIDSVYAHLWWMGMHNPAICMPFITSTVNGNFPIFHLCKLPGQVAIENFWILLATLIPFTAPRAAFKVNQYASM